MALFSVTLTKLIEEFEKLPGIGHKNASGLLFMCWARAKRNAERLANAILQARNNLKFCQICQNISDQDICGICENSARDHTTICVVQDPRDVMAMERSRGFQGVYHVLHGALSPMNGVGPDDLKIRELVLRINDDIKEVILATNPNVEGDTTAMYLAKLLRPFNIKITRIAHGIPVGGDLEYADEITLAKALQGRREF